MLLKYKVELLTGFEPVYELLQSPTSPLGHSSILARVVRIELTPRDLESLWLP